LLAHSFPGVIVRGEVFFALRTRLLSRRRQSTCVFCWSIWHVLHT